MGRKKIEQQYSVFWISKRNITNARHVTLGLFSNLSNFNESIFYSYLLNVNLYGGTRENPSMEYRRMNRSGDEIFSTSHGYVYYKYILFCNTGTLSTFIKLTITVSGMCFSLLESVGGGCKKSGGGYRIRSPIIPGTTTFHHRTSLQKRERNNLRLFSHVQSTYIYIYIYNSTPPLPHFFWQTFVLRSA
jgi:hypothetical protein